MSALQAAPPLKRESDQQEVTPPQPSQWTAFSTRTRLPIPTPLHCRRCHQSCLSIQFQIQIQTQIQIPKQIPNQTPTQSQTQNQSQSQYRSPYQSPSPYPHPTQAQGQTPTPD